jgi:ubiquinone/menaquinone biosynthesis C-methylase UbiE
MKAEKYFITSDYYDRWLKMVRKSNSLRKEMEVCLKAIEFLPLQGSWLLDIGVGEGRFMGPIIKAGIRYYIGLDISIELLKRIKRKSIYNCYSVDLIQASADYLPFRSKVFDIVICIDVTYFLQNLQFFLSDVSRVLKIDGNFFCNFMLFSTKLHLYIKIRTLINFILNLLRNSGLVKIFLKLFRFLDKVPLLGLYDGWFSSYLYYGITPFYPRRFSEILFLIKLSKFKIIKTIRYRSIFILAVKHSNNRVLR